MRRITKVASFIVPVAISLAVGYMLGGRIDRCTDKVWCLELVAGCELDYHVPPVNAVALACPGVDLMRIWPLPIVQPWCETPEPYEELARARPGLVTLTEGDRLQLLPADGLATGRVKYIYMKSSLSVAGRG